MKKCTSCKEEKTVQEFYPNKRRGDGLQSYCKKCNMLWVRKRYLRDKQYYDQKNREVLERNRLFVLDFLISRCCVDCGEKDPIVLDFDHKSDKENSISRLIRKLCCLKTLQKEIDKCEIRCANCHRRKTSRLANHFRFRYSQNKNQDSAA
jgi:hypothetical protein